MKRTPSHGVTFGLGVASTKAAGKALHFRTAWVLPSQTQGGRSLHFMTGWVFKHGEHLRKTEDNYYP